jgi:hypothetical protein
MNNPPRLRLFLPCGGYFGHDTSLQRSAQALRALD